MLNFRDIENVRIDDLSISTSLLVRAAVCVGLNYSILPERVVLISDSKQSFFFKGTFMPCNDVVAAEISNNKNFIKKLFQDNDIPVPNAVMIENYSDWKHNFRSLKFPLAVKPVVADHGDGASMFIMSEAELEHAVKKAFSFIGKNSKNQGVLIEEFYTGQDLRLLVVGDQVVSVIKRDPAYVVGDGKHTIKQLIDIFNAAWDPGLNQYELPVLPIRLDEELYRYLDKIKMKLIDVPLQGKKVTLRWNANVSTGGRTIDVTNEVHPYIKKLAVRAAQVAHLPITGVDMQCKDFTIEDATKNNISILEVNKAPGLDVHRFPYTGAGCDVGGIIINYIFNKREFSLLDSKARVNKFNTLLQDPFITEVPVS